VADRLTALFCGTKKSEDEQNLKRTVAERIWMFGIPMIN
jgi:hypothetical protein